MPPGSEIELKLAVVQGSVAGARETLRRAGLPRQDLERTAIDDVYFDTPENSLRRRGLVLRIRRDGERWMQTLKAAPSESSLVPVRGEWEVPLPAGKELPALDLERFDIAPLRVLMRTGLDVDALVPVFRSRVTRRRGMLRHGESEIEVALDEGELRAAADGKRRRKPLAEIELELKAGNADDVLALGDAIVRRAKRLALVPALRTKSERGYALAAGTAVDVARASGRGFAEQVRKDTPRADALRAVVRHGLAVLVANADALRDEFTAEHIHQARVALRRMRSAMRLFDPDRRDLPEELFAETRWLAQILGRARDWDVILDESLPSVIAAGHFSQEGQRRLQRRATRRRQRALERARRTVSSRRYARLVLRLARWSISPAPEGSDPQALDAAALLEPVADQLFRSARAFQRLTPLRRHRVRIHAKRLRYALDLLADRLPERSASEYVAALASLQDTLGELNDTVVAVEYLAPLLKPRQDEAALLDWMERTEQGLVKRGAQQLRALMRRTRPWRTGPAARTAPPRRARPRAAR